MIPFEEAYAAIMAQAAPLHTEWVPLDDAAGRILGQTLHAKDALPRFDNSGVDGYAVCAEDIKSASERSPVSLPVVEIIPAGSGPRSRIERGQAAMILTGAPMPPGADTIVMKEVTERRNGTVAIRKSAQPGANLRRAGEEYTRGTAILEKGTGITPPVQGLIAALGYNRIRVYRKPKTTIIVTGSELCAPGTTLSAGQIWESNSFAISAALRVLGIAPNIVCVDDNEARTTEAVRDAVRNSDVVITSGGISVGEYDYLRTAFRATGVRERFWRVAQKPGKPVYFGTRGNTQVYGLPGNPVSALVSLYALVRPALLRMMGMAAPPVRTVQARLEAPLAKKPGRVEFVRIQLRTNNGTYAAAPAKGQGSHMLGGLAFADGLYRFPSEAALKRKGSIIEVELLQWSIQ